MTYRRFIPNGFGLKKIAKDGDKSKNKSKNPYDEVGGGKVALGESASELAVPAILSMNPLIYPAKALSGDSGSLGGLLAHVVKEGDDKTGLSDYSGWSFIPGVGGYRNAKRDMYVDRKLSKGYNVHRSSLAEMLGIGTSGLLAGGLGASVGGLIGGKRGALIGGASLLGASTLANLIGRVAGLIRNKKTADEHAEYLKNGSLAAQYLLPGVASYHRARRAKMSGNYLN